MATTKTRINISISKDIKKALLKLAKRDEMPEATKASNLLQIALEIEEDVVLDSVASLRMSEKGKLLTGKEVWG